MTLLKQLVWIGSSKADLKNLPEDVQDQMGYSLHEAQAGRFPNSAKLLQGFSGVYEIVVDFNKDTFRSVYAVKLDDRLYVLHVFKKKSKTGIKTPKEDIELIKNRLKQAKLIAKLEK